jgi:hypothetical protein
MEGRIFSSFAVKLLHEHCFISAVTRAEVYFIHVKTHSIQIHRSTLYIAKYPPLEGGKKSAEVIWGKNISVKTKEEELGQK